MPRSPPAAGSAPGRHGRDTTIGRRFRMTGGAALADAGGTALPLLPLPDGEATAEFSYDLMLTTAEGSRLFTDRRADRPPVTAATPANVASLGALTLYCPESGAQPAPGTGAIAPGQSLVALTGAVSAQDFTAVDMTSLRASDVSAALPNRADGSDRIVTFEPAFTQTPPGDLPAAQTPGGRARVHEGGFHATARGQEMFDFAAYDTSGNAGVIGAVAGRRLWHEAPPAALARPGVNAAPEIHGDGLGIAGPAGDRLRLLMRERRVADIPEFVGLMGRTFTVATPPSVPGPWTAVLETAAKGTHGGLLISLIPDALDPGAIWDSADPASPGIKQRLDAVLAGLPGGLTVDGIVDTATFDDDIASAFRLLGKNRGGVQGFARAALAALGRAEDLIWLPTLSLDAEAFHRSRGRHPLPGGDHRPARGQSGAPCRAGPAREAPARPQPARGRRPSLQPRSRAARLATKATTERGALRRRTRSTTFRDDQQCRWQKDRDERDHRAEQPRRLCQHDRAEIGRDCEERPRHGLRRAIAGEKSVAVDEPSRSGASSGPL